MPHKVADRLAGPAGAARAPWFNRRPLIRSERATSYGST
jgi:hypothetical protein